MKLTNELSMGLFHWSIRRLYSSSGITPGKHADQRGAPYKHPKRQRGTVCVCLREN